MEVGEIDSDGGDEKKCLMHRRGMAWMGVDASC